MQSECEVQLSLANQASQESLPGFLKSITENSKLFVFTEFATHPVIKKFLDSDAKSSDLMRLFSYGTYAQYLSSPDRYAKLQLSALQLNKLKQLSIISRFSQASEVSFSQLCKQNDISKTECVQMLLHLSELELVKIKIDERLNRIKIQACISRDLRPNGYKEIQAKLNQLIYRTKTVNELLEKQAEIMTQAR